MEGEVLSMHDIFEYRQVGIDAERRAIGDFHATGIRPHCYDRLENAGVHVPVELFEPRMLELAPMRAKS